MANYLYNGIELPALPEYDKTAYPYAYVYLYTDYSGGRLILSPVPLTYSGYTDETNYFYATADCTVMIYKLTISEGVSGSYVPSNWEYYSSKTMNPDTSAIRAAGNFNWANTDTYKKSDGTLYLAASDPVPVPDEPESVLAWQKHDAYKPNTKWDGNTFYRVMGGKWVKQGVVSPSLVEDEPTGEPIAYLYNGVRLPDINEVWTDKVAYPYAMIYTSEYGYHELLLTSCEYKKEKREDMFVPKNTGEEILYHYAVTGEGLLFLKQLGYNVKLNELCFGKSQTTAVGQPQYRLGPLVWTSYDIYNDDIVLDGSLYLATSDPVPVWDEPTGESTDGVIDWDGNPTDVAVSLGEGAYLYKVSDLTPAIDELIGCSVFVQGEIVLATEEHIQSIDNFVFVLDALFVAYEDNSVFDGLTIPEKGFYAVSDIGAFTLVYTPQS